MIKVKKCVKITVGSLSRSSSTNNSINGFGCSDCKCFLNLFKVSDYEMSNLGVKAL